VPSSIIYACTCLSTTPAGGQKETAGHLAMSGGLAVCAPVSSDETRESNHM